MSEFRHDEQHPSRAWSCDRVHDELEGWALGALDEEASEAVEEHLAACEPCRRDASALARVTTLLPFSLPPVSPSAEAKHALMARIADEQMAVAAAQSQLRAPLAPAAATPSTITPPGRFHWSQFLVTPLAIALLVMTLWSLDLRGQVDDGGDAGTTRVSMLPEGFETFTLQSECEKCKAATGKMLADPQQASALMVAWNLDPGEVHEVWCEEGDGSKVLVANLDVSDNGDVVQPLVFDKPVEGYSRIYVVNSDGETAEIRLAGSGGVPPSPAPLQQH